MAITALPQPHAVVRVITKYAKRIAHFRRFDTNNDNMKSLRTAFLLAAAATTAQAGNGLTPITLPAGNYYHGYYGDFMTPNGEKVVLGGDPMMSSGTFQWSAAAGLLDAKQIITGTPSAGYSSISLHGVSADLSKIIVEHNFSGNNNWYVDFATGSTQAITVPGASWQYTLCLSSNGLQVGGYYNLGGHDYGFIWSPDGTLTTNIGASLDNAHVLYVGNGGSWALGDGNLGSSSQVFLWKRSDGSMTTFHSIAGLAVGDNASIRYYSLDGTSVVINKWAGSTSTNYRWIPATGQYTHLDLSAFGTYSNATGFSDDGSTILLTAGDSRVHRWTATGWNHDLTSNLSGVTSAESNSYNYGYGMIRSRNISADGNAVVGSFSTASTSKPFYWTASTGAIDLFTGAQAGWQFNGAYMISANGLVAAGSYYDGSNVGIYRWSASSGLQTIPQWLQSHGVDVSPYAGWLFGYASAISDDGSVLLVSAITPSSGSYMPFLASAKGVADYEAWMSSVNNQHRIYATGATLAGLPLEGAHHRPMLSFDRMGKESQAWATGDFGSTSDARDVHVTTGEAGVNWNLGKSFLFGVAAGHGEQNSDLAFDGSSSTKGDYAIAELDYRPEGTQWIVSLLGMVGSWESKTSRGYLNGASTDFSYGVADLITRTARLRVDAPSLVTFGGFGFAPYASYSVTQTVVDAYAETGGAFPASFDKQEHNATEARVGITAAKDLSAATKLLLTVEAIHRFDGVGPSLTGQDVTGGVSFSLPGTAPRADSVRFGFDVDHKLSENTLLNLSAHAATVGEEHDVSAAISIRRAF